ncbi:MAG: hypothetical protein KDE27_24970, partial [Planctomycetes bacterium]|nr:hypothetical protein [Planctomycetota bacterium]
MALLFCWLPVACAGPLPDIAPMDGARAALGIDDVLELRVESEPLDAAAVDADTEPLTLAAALRRAVLH